MVMRGAHGHPISTPDFCRWCPTAERGDPLLGQQRHRCITRSAAACQHALMHQLLLRGLLRFVLAVSERLFT